jgi:threonine synthase
MGLPINKLVVATNQNDILHRAISNGKYETESVSKTISPSMDIQVASNFERLIYDLTSCDDLETRNIMKEIKKDGKYIISKKKLEKIKNDFLSASMDELEVMNVIKEVYEKYKIILDPHSAIGFGALNKVKLEGNSIVLATAHPCKFPDAINSSINIKPSLPEELKHILNEKENYDVISNNLVEIKKYITSKIQ